MLEEDISKEELFDAMMTLRRGRTPGCDGLSIELIYRFWKTLVDPLHEMYMVAWQNGSLNSSGKRGIINLIPKKSRSETEIRNWRPICLLNQDFKIWAKAIANRLESVTHLINPHQTGFIKNRSILFNIRKTMEVVAHAKRTNRPGLIVTIDFEKCFDRVEYTSIRGAFKYLGFGNKFISMMFLLFNNLQMCTTSNGFTSQFFYKTRGVNQGCPGSPLIYSFCGEIMSRLILKNQQIKGITVNEIENILTQFADDTAAFLTYDPLVLNAFTDTLRKVESEMGLKISYDKTSVYRIGSIHNSNAKLYTQDNLNWSNDPIQLLGILIPCDGTMDQSNWDVVVTKVRNTCNTLLNRQATLMGKVLIINALIGSLFVYKMSTMSNLSDNEIKTVEDIIRRFIWNDKRPKIAFEMLQKRKIDGGLGLVNLKAKQDAIKISWIFKDMDESMKKSLYCTLNPKIGDMIWRCNLNTVDTTKLYDCKEFWAQVLQAWSKINFRDLQNIVSHNDVSEQIIWLNSLVRVDNKPIMWNSWFDKGIITIGDLFINGVVNDHVRLGVNWLDLSSLYAALPKEWVEIMNVQHQHQGTIEPPLFVQLSKIKSVSKIAYNILTEDKEYLM